jgi:predicted nucleic acid-binding protein
VPVASRTGAPAELVRRWLAGEFELVASAALLAELERALRYPKLVARIAAADAAACVSLMRDRAEIASDPADPPRRSPDPDDDYLPALAEAERAVLVSGDRHLLGLADRMPVRSARAFVELLG